MTRFVSCSALRTIDRCTACHYPLSYGMLCIDRSFAKQNKKQNVSWSETKLQVKLTPLRYDLCKKVHLKEYMDGVTDKQGDLQRLWSDGENESGNTLEDLILACKYIITNQEPWEALTQ